jgi:hypothetical protein
VIEIPSGLRRNEIEVASVVLSVQKLSHWPSLERVPFFPLWSNHGFQHIQEVLETADRLIHPQTRQHLTSNDVAVLILGVALHDLAMHLTQDGLCRLVLGQSTLKPIAGADGEPYFDDEPYPDLWKKFVEEARRFSPARNERLFGSENPVAPPDPHDKEWTPNQFKLAGEFVRRHHPRLAHEIALYGFPGARAERPVVDADFPRELRNLAGVLARSHGLSLRKCVDYVKFEYLGAYRDPHNTHIHFLMALLRVGDYLQIHKERVHESEDALEPPTSADTMRERAKHHAVEHLSWDTDDPEQIYVLAKPPDVRIYLALRDLFADMQMELDTSGAVLSEIYRDSRFALSKRRIRSSLDERSFRGRLDYLTEHATFHADARLLKELAGPLYANQPEFGVRELVQNSTDAARQLDAALLLPEVADAWRKQTGGDVERPLLPGDVVVTLRENREGAWLEVADRGIGMSSEIILEYFLNVGASFDDRASPWQAKVLRAGFFGVGVLAAFLLSDEIEVETRRAGEKRGWKFQARIDSDPIDVRKFDRPVGTTIRLRISHDMYERLKWREQAWDWYCFRSPSVIRVIDGAVPRTLEQRTFVPPPGEPAEGWRALAAEPGISIHWQYPRDEIRGPSREYVVVNGLLVAQTDRFYSETYLWQDRRSCFRIRMPGLSIVGPSVEIRLNLQRTAIDFEHCRFYKQLVDDFVTQNLRWFLLDGMPGEPCTRPSLFKEYYESFRLRGLMGHYPFELPPWLLLPGGVAPFEARVLQRLGSERVQILSVSAERPHDEDSSYWFSPPDSILKELQEYFLSPISEGVPKVLIEDDESSVLTIMRLHEGGPVPLELPVIGARSLLNTEQLLESERLSDSRLGETLERSIWREGPWVLLETGACDISSLDFRRLAADAGTESDGLFHIASEIFLDPQAQVYESPIAAAWNRHMAHPVIPFDRAERERLHARSFESLPSPPSEPFSVTRNFPKSPL